METVTPELLVSVLATGGLLALVKRSLSGPPGLHGVVNVVLRSTTCAGDAEHDMMVFESAESGATGPLSLEDPLAILLHVATVLAFLHTIDEKRSLVHGNLNIDAISVVAGIIAISGFEYCCIQSDESTSEPPDAPERSEDPKGWESPPAGHIPSMALELINGGMHTTQTDVYAFGMLMFRMYAGAYPFEEVKSRYGVAATARLGGGKRPARESIKHQHFTDELWALMDECWAQNPSARPTMVDVRARLAQLVGDRASRSRGDEEPPSALFETD